MSFEDFYISIKNFVRNTGGFSTKFIYTYTATVYTYISRVCSLYEIGELSACLYLRIHGVERTRASCEIRRLVYTTKIEKKRKNRGRKMEETDPLVCSAWLHHVSSCTTRNNRGNISPPIYPWKILATAMTMIKSFRFFRFFLLWKRSLFYRSSFDFIISIYYEFVWISILFFYIYKLIINNHYFM